MIFCFAYVILFTIVMIVIYCIKGSYPEQLCTLTFAYFSIETIVSAGIKAFEIFSGKKSKEESYIEEDENSSHKGEVND